MDYEGLERVGAAGREEDSLPFRGIGKTHPGGMLMTIPAV